MPPITVLANAEAFRLLGDGLTKVNVVDELSIGVASVYRIVGTQKEDA